MPSSSGTEPGGSPEPIGAPRGTAESAHGRLRVRERSDPRAHERGRDPVRVHHRGEHRLVGVAGDPAHGERHLVGGRRDGRHEQDEHRVDRGVREQDRQRRLVARGGRRAEHVDGVREAALAGQKLAPGAPTVSSPSDGSSSPAASQASAARIPRPPAFVSTATRRPRGSGWVESSTDTSTSSSSVSARITPAWWKSAAAAASELASAAVCEPAAFAPADVRAALQREDRLRARRPGARCARTCAGCRTTRGRARRGSSRRRPRTTRAGRSTRRRPCSRSRRTRRARSRALPRPRSARARARRSATRSRSSPSAAPGRANVAFRLGAGDAIPRQFGPISRAPYERTSASSCSCRSTPSDPISANPAEITQSARTPLRSASSAAARTCSPGTQMTARSIASGISSIDV